MEHTTHDTEKEKDIAALREEVRKAIQAAVPDITEHREECLCRIHGNCPFKSHDKVGRPITLEDCLRAIELQSLLSGFQYMVDVCGDIYKLPDGNNPILCCRWTLGKSLDDQSDPTIRFLASILL